MNMHEVFMADPMLLNICLALILSGSSFSVIFVLDKIADADWTGDAADEAIRQIIGGIAILVGFAWEQCFDVAVASLSSVMPAPHLMKFILAVFCVAIIVPAWFWFLLPMAVRKGWKCGFVVEKDMLVEAMKYHHEETEKDLEKEEKAEELTPAQVEKKQQLRAQKEALEQKALKVVQKVEAHKEP